MVVIIMIGYPSNVRNYFGIQPMFVIKVSPPNSVNCGESTELQVQMVKDAANSPMNGDQSILVETEKKNYKNDNILFLVFFLGTYSYTHTLMLPKSLFNRRPWDRSLVVYVVREMPPHHWASSVLARKRKYVFLIWSRVSIFQDIGKGRRLPLYFYSPLIILS